MNECSGEIRALNTDLHTGDQHCPPTHAHSVCEGKNLLKTFVWVESGASMEFGDSGGCFWTTVSGFKWFSSLIHLYHILDCVFSMY